MKFSHSGAIGDIIYHLPVVKELGGGEFYIIPADRDFYRSRTDMQYTSLKPLLEVQSYLTKVGWSDVRVGICFDEWRARLDFSKNLTNQAAQWLGMAPIPDTCPPWLEVGEPNLVAPVVFARSTRNNNPNFPWKTLVDKYRDKAVFLGVPGEHEAFVAEFGHIPNYQTKDLLEAAKVIKGGKLFISNATGLLAVAEGLKQKCIISSTPVISHCVCYVRPWHQHCWDIVEEMWDV